MSRNPATRNRGHPDALSSGPSSASSGANSGQALITAKPGSSTGTVTFHPFGTPRFECKHGDDELATVSGLGTVAELGIAELGIAELGTAEFETTDFGTTELGTGIACDAIPEPTPEPTRSGAGSGTGTDPVSTSGTTSGTGTIRRRGRSRRLLALVSILLAFTLAGAWAWLTSLDVNAYKGELEARVAAATGRVLTIGGDVSVDWWPALSLTLGGVSLSNAPWASADALVSAERLSARVALLPLLRREVRIEALHLEGVTVNAERDGAGAGSWNLTPPEGRDLRPEPDPEAGVALALVAATVDGAVIHYRTPTGGHRVTLNELRIAPLPTGPGLAFEASGTGAGIGWTADGTGASLADLLRLETLQPFTLRIRAGGGELRLAGEAAPRSGTWRARLAGSTASLSAYTSLAGVALPDLPLELEAELRGAGGAALEADRLTVRSGATRAFGTAALAWENERPSLAVVLALPALDLGSPAEASPAPDRARVLPDVRFPWAVLDAADVRGELSVDRLTGAGIELRDVRAAATLRAGRLKVEPASARLGRGPVRLTLDADARSKRLTVTARAADLDVASAVSALGRTPELDTRADVAVALSGRGDGLHEWLGTAAGHVRWMSGEGRLSGRILSDVSSLDAAVGGLTGVLSAFSAKGSERAALSCLTADLAVENGVATPRVLVGDTRHATVVGSGRIDLAQERLALRLEPSPKSVTLNVSVPVEVGGTWREPIYTLDKAAIGRRVGTVAAVLLFPPAALASLAGLGTVGVAVAGGAGDAGSGAGNPCLALAKPGARGAGERARDRERARASGDGTGASHREAAPAGGSWHRLAPMVDDRQ